ncbi:unnamed protein product [Amoebophrya sp. A25]|nr:unnamed protein product [Amoebophrya sp. A25]|eukprot:GSA25T00020585001.1
MREVAMRHSLRLGGFLLLARLGLVHGISSAQEKHVSIGWDGDADDIRDSNNATALLQVSMQAGTKPASVPGSSAMTQPMATVLGSASMQSDVLGGEDSDSDGDLHFASWDVVGVGEKPESQVSGKDSPSMMKLEAALSVAKRDALREFGNYQGGDDDDSDSAPRKLVLTFEGYLEVLGFFADMHEPLEVVGLADKLLSKMMAETYHLDFANGKSTLPSLPTRSATFHNPELKEAIATTMPGDSTSANQQYEDAVKSLKTALALVSSSHRGDALFLTCSWLLVVLKRMAVCRALDTMAAPARGDTRWRQLQRNLPNDVTTDALIRLIVDLRKLYEGSCVEALSSPADGYRLEVDREGDSFFPTKLETTDILIFKRRERGSLSTSPDSMSALSRWVLLCRRVQECQAQPAGVRSAAALESAGVGVSDQSSNPIPELIVLVST